MRTMLSAIRVPWVGKFRYQLVLATFFFGVALVGVVLYITLEDSKQKTQEQFSTTQDAITKILADASRTALITREYGVLQRFIERVAEDPRVDGVQVLDSTGKVVASLDTALLGQLLSSQSNYPRDRIFSSVSLENATGPIGSVNVIMSTGSIDAAIVDSRVRGIAIGLAGLLISAAISFGFGSLFGRRFGRLSSVIRRLGEGDLTARAPMDGSDEIAALGHSINSMASSLQEGRVALMVAKEEQALAKLSRILASTDDPVDVFPEIAGEIRELMPAERVLLALIDINSPTYSLFSSDGATTEHSLEVTQPRLSGSGTELAINAREPILIDNNELAIFREGLPEFDEDPHPEML